MKSGLHRNLVGVMGLVLVLSGAARQVTPAVADAARRGDRETVENLLKAGADVNAALGDGTTALHWAAERGDALMAEMLLQAGANVRAFTRIGQYTPLHLAAKSGNARVVETLLKAGSEVNAVTTNSGATPLHLAAASGSADAVALLLDHGAEVDAREAEWQQTPLIFAASLNREAVVRALLERGADPDFHTWTRDGSAVAQDNEAARVQREMLQAFQAAGRELTASMIQAAIAAGRAARQFAEGEAEAEEQQLADRDPDEPPLPVGNQPSPGGLTALHHAARQGSVDAARALLEGGADINIRAVNDQTTPLLIAALNGQWDVAMLLLEHGANPNLHNSVNDYSPLYATINARWQHRTRYPQPQEQDFQRHSYLDVVEAMLKAGADPDHRIRSQPFHFSYSGCGNANCGVTPLGGTGSFFRAALAADVDALRLLHAYGADPVLPRVQALGGGGRGGGGGGNPAAAAQAQQFAAAAGGRGGQGGGGRGGGGGAAAAGGRGGPPGGAGGAAAGARAGGQGGPPAELVAAAAAGRGGGGGGRGGADAAAAQVPTAPATAIHAAAGIGFGQGVGAGNGNRFMENGWLPSVRFLVEELGFDVNARDDGGFTPLHFAAARGDVELIHYLVEKGADVQAVARNGQTTADMANGPQARITPMPAIVELMVSLGAVNNNNCRSCE